MVGCQLQRVYAVCCAAQGKHSKQDLISPVSTWQVDGALLSHPNVAEAVSFGAPDEKYGETVAAAIVPANKVDDVESFIADVKKHAASKLAKFKVSQLSTSMCMIIDLHGSAAPHWHVAGWACS